MSLAPGTHARIVLDAVSAGWMNAPDIAAETGIPKDQVSVWLGRLAREGFIRLTHRAWGTFHADGTGRRFNRYGPARA